MSIAVARAALRTAGLALIPVLAQAFPDGAPAAHTGGFGEPTCAQCHFGGEPAPENGGLRLERMGDRYEAGRNYTFDLVLRDPALAAGGFQASVRFAEGERRGLPAGELRGEGEGFAVRRDGEVEYPGHAQAWRPAQPGGEIRWRLRWLAPETVETVVFHFAAVAGDDDASPLGDNLHVLEYWLQSGERTR